MQPLQDVIAALRREIEEGLAQNKPLPGNSRLEAERVVVSLQFAISESAARNGTAPLQFVADQGKGGNGENPSARHSITIEFKVGRESHSSSASTPSTMKATGSTKESNVPLRGAEANRVQTQLALVFGEPGFDSSARATVFREILQNLPAADLPLLAPALTERPEVSPKPTVAKAVARLDRVLKSGPSGISQGREIIAKVLNRHEALPLIDLVAKLWKSQEDWIS